MEDDNVIHLKTQRDVIVDVLSHGINEMLNMGYDDEEIEDSLFCLTNFFILRHLPEDEKNNENADLIMQERIADYCVKYLNPDKDTEGNVLLPYFPDHY